MFERTLPRGRAAGAIILALTTSMLLATVQPASAATGVRAVQVTTGDTGNGKLDKITVTFSVPMSQTTPQVSSGPGVPGFRVDGYQIAGFTWTSSTALNINLTEKSTYDGNARPVVTYEGPGGGAQSTIGELEAFTQTALDRAGPVLVGAYADDQGNASLFNRRANASSKGDSLTLVFSEPATLAGVNALTRWNNLERAIRFNNAGSGCTDGQGTSTSFNFPQPDAAGSDPILEPKDDDTYTTTFRINYVPDALPSTPYKFPGVPAGCWLGIEPDSVLNGGTITDEVGNAAIRQVTPPVIQTWVNPVDASLLFAETKDLNADGRLDAVQLVFDQLLDDSTIQANLSGISVRLGSTVAGVTGFDTGAIENDNVILLPFTLPAGTVWDTGIQPVVRYTKPGTCTATGGTGLKAIPPAGGTFRTCVGSFDLTSYDRAKPRVAGAVTTDANGNGKLDRVTVTFTEPITQGTAAGWKLNGNNATGFTILPGGRSAELPIAEGATGDTGSSATLSYTPQTVTAQQTRDAWNNEVPATDLIATDAAAPRILTARVSDANADGRLDRLVLTYSEPIVEPAPAKASKFQVGGVPATAFTTAGESDLANDATLALVIDVPGTGAKDVSYEGGNAIVDATGNVSGSQLVPASSVTDAAAPRATVAVSPTAPLGPGTATVTVTYTEAMDAAVAPTVTIAGKAVAASATDHTNGFRNGDRSIWEGTVNIAVGDCTVATGCEATVSSTAGEDPAGNLQAVGTFVTEIDTIAPQPATLGTFSTVQTSNAAPADTVNRQTRGVSLGATFPAGDAAGGTAELLVDGIELTDPAPIGASATAVTLAASFETLEDLADTFDEGTAALTVRLCDDAGNCSESSSHSVLVDLTPVAVTLVSPTDDRVVAGGETLTVTWDADETAADFSHVDLQLSTNGGSTYPTTIASGLTSADGSTEWTAPAIDTNAAQVRAVAVDAAGNRSFGTATQSFAIDSTAPIVSVTKVGTGTFQPGATTIRWSVTDATVDRVTDPITIEYSADGGATWLPINGGAYSAANDGAEAWDVPAGPLFDLRVRVSAIDATDATGLDTSSRLVTGVAGLVAGANGRVVPFGSSTADVDESKVKRGFWNAGMALAPNGRTGYTISGSGRLFPFSVDGTTPPRAYNLKLKAGTVRDLVLIGKDKGYVLDQSGRVFRFGGAPKATPTRTWSGDRARALVLTSDGKGGYVLDAYGKPFPIAIGNREASPRIKMRRLFSNTNAVDMVLNSDDASGYILRNNGKVYRFGGAAGASTTGVSKKAEAAALVRITDTAGYWIDGKGNLTPYGDAYGDPTVKRLGRYGTRGAAAL